MTLDDLLKILAGIGIDDDLLEQATGDWQLRADLALSSAETTALHQRIKETTGRSMPLWGEDDLSLSTLIHLTEDTADAVADL